MALDKIKIAKEADAFIRQGKKLEAIGKFNLLIKDNPKDLVSQNRIGELYLELGRNEDAIEAFRKAAEMFAKDGFYPKAIAVYKKAMRIDEKRADLHERLVALYDQSGMSGQAKESLDFLSTLYQGKGDLVKAAEFASRLVKLDPKNARARLRLGDLLVRNKKVNEGVNEYLTVGRELLKDGAHTAEALKVFDRALQLDPANINVVRGLADCHLALKDPGKAIAAVKAALDKTPQALPLRRFLADLLYENKQPAEALAAYQQLAAAGPLDAVAGPRYLQMVMQQRGETAAEPVLKALVSPLLTQKTSADAEGLVAAFLAVHPDNMAVLELGLQVAETAHDDGLTVQRLTTLEQLYIQRGMHEQARAAIQQILEIEPYNDGYRKKMEALASGQSLAPGSAPSAEPPVAEDGIEDMDISMEVESINDAPEATELTDAEEVAEATLTVEAAEDEVEELEMEMESEEEEVVEMEAEEMETEEPEEELEIEAESEPATDTPVEAALPEPAAAATPPKDDKTFVKERSMEAEVFIKYGLIDKALEQYRRIVQRLPEELDTRQRMKQLYMEQGAQDKALVQIVKMVEILDQRGDGESAASLLDEALAINPANPKVAELAARLSGAQPGLQETQPAAALTDAAKLAVKATEKAADQEAAISHAMPLPESSPESEPAFTVDAPAESPEMMTFEETAAPEAAAVEFEPAAPEALEVEVVAEPESALTNAAASAPRKHSQVEPKAVPPAPAPAPASPPEKTAPAKSGMLDMDDLLPGEPVAASSVGTEDFVDLAADLEAALSGIGEETDGDDLFGAQRKAPEEMSFDEVLADFKKGVDSQVDAEDYSTHYNLGIAYKEMGLLSDACNEFQYCMRSPQYFLESISMMGVCLREEGKLEQAIEWYREALKHDTLSGEQKLALRYEEADTLEQAGNREGALSLFEEIAAQNNAYRGVTERISALRDG